MTAMLDQLLQLLERLLADGDITEAQAESIYRYWQAKPPDELARVLPLALAVGVGPLSDQERDEYASLLLTYAAADRAQSRRARITAANRVQEVHAELSAQLARDFEARRIPLTEWQSRQRMLNASALAALSTLGSPRGTAALQRRIAEIERQQAAYLQRFADQLSAGRLAAAVEDDDRRSVLALWAAWGAAYLARRAASYSGVGRGVFFEALEGSGAEVGPGWVIRYEARDDDRTCSRCADAQGYYLPGDGPMPGEICYGGGWCRCERIAVYDPAMYAQLTGGQP